MAIGTIKKESEDPCQANYQANFRESLSAIIEKDSTEWDGSFTAMCTIHVTEYTVNTQSKD